MPTFHRTPHTLKSLTLKLSPAEGVAISDLQGKRYRVTVPLNGLVFDNHSTAPAWFYAVFPLQLGSSALPVPDGIALTGSRPVMSGTDNDDPRQAIVARLVFEIEFADDAPEFETLPLVVKGFAAATNAPASFTLPAFTPSADAPFVVADADGGALATGIIVEDIVQAQIDADTLQGEDSDYYLSRANHTGTQAISTVSGLGSALNELAEASLPPGGTTGQVLAKTSGSHYDVDWMDAASGGGGDGGDAETLEGENGDFYRARANHTGTQTLSSISDAGTAAAFDVPAAGDAASGEVVKGNDSRLTDARTPASHNHDDRYYTEGEIDSALAGKASASHTHDDRYYTESEADALLSSKADLISGVIPTSQLPAIAIGETFTAASEAAMLALDAQHGDVAIRTDESSKKYLLLDEDPTEPGNWTALGASGGDVTSINSQTGDVVLGYSDVGAAPASTATALSSHTGDTNNPHSVTKTQVGLTNVSNDAQLKIASNLGDLNSSSTARSNLGLGTAAVLDVAASGNASSGEVVKGNDTRLQEVICIAVTGEGLPLTTGTNKVTFRMPFAMVLSEVRASLTTASSSGNPTFDINEGGSTILSTKLSIDASEKTSTTAATAAVISDSSLADDAEITVDIDTAGTGAAGAKIYLFGTRA